MIKPPKPVDPARAIVVSIIWDRFRLRAPVAAVVAVVLAFTPGLALLLNQPPPTQGPGPTQEWTADSGLPFAAASFIRSALPPPDPRQKRKPCNPDFEVELEGLCWVQLVASKCPPDAVVYNGKCLWRVLPVEKLPRPPTSGDVTPPSVADPE